MSYWTFRAGQRAAARDRRFRERTIRQAHAKTRFLLAAAWWIAKLPLALALVAVGVAIRGATYRPTGFRRRPSGLIRTGTRMLRP